MTEFATAVPARDSGPWFGEGLATRQAGDVLMGGASGASSLLLNTKASHEAACSRAPAAIAPGPEPELHGAGVSLFSGNGSHLEAADAAKGHAGLVDGPGSREFAKNGSHLESADFNDESGRYCGGTPHRTVQNQVVCRTGRPRRTVRYRKRPCGVRELILAPGPHAAVAAAQVVM